MRSWMDKAGIPDWLHARIIVGAEGEGDGGSGDGGDGGDGDGDDGDGEGDGDGAGGSGGDGKSGKSDDDVEGLKKALREERRARKKAEREAREAKEKKQTEQEQNDLEKVSGERDAYKTRTERLAARLRSREVDSAILEAARKLNFIDPTDALTDGVRAAVEVDQDEDDPSDIEVDQDTVTRAVKDLANKKKHFLAAGNGDGQPSAKLKGNKKSGSADGEKTQEQKFLEDYPSLR